VTEQAKAYIQYFAVSDY